MKPTEAQPAEYLKRPYSRVLVPDPDGGFSATVLEWPGCYGEGETAEEAMASLEESMVVWVSVMLEDGRPIPEPLAREYSGKMMLSRPVANRAAGCSGWALGSGRCSSTALQRWTRELRTRLQAHGG